jgi:hypothetical protein
VEIILLFRRFRIERAGNPVLSLASDAGTGAAHARVASRRPHPHGTKRCEIPNGTKPGAQRSSASPPRGLANVPCPRTPYARDSQLVLLG